MVTEGPLVLLHGFDDGWDFGSCPCRFTEDDSAWEMADAVVFHQSRLHVAPTLVKPPGQVWVAYCQESEVTIPSLAHPPLMAHFDLKMTYQRSADVWVPYFGSWILPELARPARPKTATYPVARVQSHAYDRSGRNRYSLELMRRIKVASYGRMTRNASWPTPKGRASSLADGWSGRGRPVKLDVIARHKFTLAFENSIAEDYVTEKFFDPLIAGSVPVYLGAPNVADFAPADHCFVDTADFAGPDELARYLDHLDRRDDEYEAYLAWKRTGVSERFLELVGSVAERPFCRAAELVAARR